MRIIFMGGHNLGKQTLQKLIDKGKNIVAVVTNTEDEWYRGVDEIARENGLLLFENVNINSAEFIKSVEQLNPDLIVVVNFSQILKQQIIGIPKKGCINTHASLLPDYRGRAPLNWAIINGEKRVGVTVHYIETGIDTGDIIIQAPVVVEEDDYIENVLMKVTSIYPDVVNNAVDLIVEDKVIGKKQDISKGSYFGKRTASDGEIDWTKDARQIFNLIRAVSRPYPGAFSYIGDNSRVVIWRTELIDQTELQKSLPNGCILKVDTNHLLVKAKNKNLLITEYEIMGEQHNIQEKNILKAGGKEHV